MTFFQGQGFSIKVLNVAFVQRTGTDFVIDVPRQGQLKQL